MHVLVAEDDLASAKLTTFVLQDAGYQVSTACTGHDALSALERQVPDLVLLDVQMPQLSGFELCQQIRRSSDVPIMFLSAQGELQDRVRGLQSGGDDYLVKPYEPAELVMRVEAVLRRCALDASTRVLLQLKRGDLLLDLNAHSARLADGEPLPLTPLEFRLLEYLMHNAGQVVSSAQIFNRVWGYADEQSANIVKLVVRRLRRKIEPDPELPRYITTVRGLGYMFVVKG
jgi:DNA-binding response OmpR family regulator